MRKIYNEEFSPPEVENTSVAEMSKEEKADHNKHIKWQCEQIKRGYARGSGKG